MLLAVDIGNTTTTFGLFKGGKLIRKIRLSTADVIKGKAVRRKVEYAVICSVVPKAERILKAGLSGLSKKGVLVLGKDIKVPIRNLYKNPIQVGQDRLAAAYAAYKLYGTDRRPLVVIDFGTAVTFDVVSKKGAYMGGLIIPGMEMALEALSEKAALLPKVSLRKPAFILGKTTADSMRSGAFYGYAAMCDGLIAKLRDKLGCGLDVIATGGTAPLVFPLSKSIKKIDTDLVLKGIYFSAQN